MVRYVLKRLLFLIPVIIAVSFIVFGLMELAPGDITDTMISETMTPEDIAELRAQYNLDKSMFYRYGVYMLKLVQGDLGVSDVTEIDVWRTFITRLPNTLILSFSALIIGVIIAIPLGIVAARHAGSLVDNITTGITLIGMSMPAFWIGILLLLFFSLRLGWLPGGGNDAGIRSLILPAICSGLSMTAASARQTRSGMLEVLRSDYLRTARAKGVPESTVIVKHALGNAWIPIITVIGSSLCVQLAGAVVIEQVFAWPGIGRMAAEAVFARDVTTTTGTIIMTTILYVLVQLIVDILYAFVDPRIKSQYVSMGRSLKRSSARVNAAPAVVSEKGNESEGNVPASAVAAASADQPQAGGSEEQEYAGQQSGIADTIAAGQQEETATLRTGGESNEDAVTGKAAELHKETAVSKAAESMERIRTGDGAGESVRATRTYRKRGRVGEVFHRIRQNKGAMVGLIILCILVLMFIISFFMSYDSVFGRDAQIRLSPPNWPHLFGTDNMGRDVFLRVVYGTRYTMAIGFGGSAISLIIGVTLGAIAGYFGNKTENLIMRMTDTLASIPGMLLGMVIVTVLGQSLQNLIIAVGVAGIPNYIRTTRASVLTVRNQEYIEASKAIGFPNRRIIFTQALPNALSPIIVAFTIHFGVTIIVAASLSFIGFGVPIPNPEWGSMIANGRVFMLTSSWLATYPGLFIMLTVLAFNLLGDGLRDALDPKLKR